MTNERGVVSQMELDDTDRAIVAELLQDSRASQRELARAVGVAQGTITNRRYQKNNHLIF